MRSTARLCPLAALVLASAAQAEVAGGIAGRITESGSGKPVESAAVVVTGAALPGERIARTDSAGEFDVPELPPGAYTLDVQAQGYQSFTREDVVVRLDRRSRLELTMFPLGGGAAFTVAEQPAIPAGTTETGGTVAHDQMELVPYGRESRSFEQAAAAVPGVLVGPFGVAVPYAPFGTRTYVDGADVTGHGLRLSQRLVDEVSVLTGGYSAEYGRASGAIVHAVTSAGGNEFHGSVFTDAVPFEAPRTQPGDPLRYAVQPGVEVGGPIQRDRLWFHGGFAPEAVAYEGRTVTDLQYTGKLTFAPADGQLLSLSAFGNPGSGAGANDLALRYLGAAGPLAVEGIGSWSHARSGTDRVEGAVNAAVFGQLLGHHRFKAGVDAGSEDKDAFLAGFAQDSWRVLDAPVWLDAGVRYEMERDLTVVLPRLGVAWDFRGGGLSRLYASWGRFADPGVAGFSSAFSAGVQTQVLRDMVGLAEYTRRPGYDGLTLSLGKRVSQNYFFSFSYTRATGEVPNLFRADLAYAYEWTPRTTVSFGAAVSAVNTAVWAIGVDFRGTLRYALTPTYQLAVNVDILNAADQQADPTQAPLAGRLGAALAF